MKEKVNRVMNGFINLSLDERNELIREINRFNEASIYEKETIKRNVSDLQKSYTVGPRNNYCECCGK